MLGTNLLLYYDAWQNRFLVCIMISVLEFFSTTWFLDCSSWISRAGNVVLLQLRQEAR